MTKIQPSLVIADQNGNIYDRPELLMVCRRGHELALPKPEELIPLPEESNLFLLPNRKAIGLNPETGELEVQNEMAVAAFVCPAHTLTANTAYLEEENIQTLPLFAYAAIGFANNKFYVCAKKVDTDLRQVFSNISQKHIQKSALDLIKTYPENRLLQHITKQCALTYSCPAAKNFCLGRFEAPLPISQSCNARCLGCISKQDENSPIKTTPQCRLKFRPTPEEIVEVMEIHAGREKKVSIFSFGQGCEGEPLVEHELINEAILLYKKRNNKYRGTINLNTNASIPKAIEKLSISGLTSMRVSLNSAVSEIYDQYYRPQGYTLNEVKESILLGKKSGLFVSLNLLYFSGITDSETEFEALLKLITETKIDFIQLRNLNIDPLYYLTILNPFSFGPNMGLNNFIKRLKKNCPWVKFGYFNPYIAKE